MRAEEEKDEKLEGRALKEELERKATPLRLTKHNNRVVYAFDHRDSAALMSTLGLLRQESFTNAGGGVQNKPSDVDEHDLHPENPYRQLVVWDPQALEIIGGYRYQLLRDSPKAGGLPLLASAKLFMFSPRFMNEYYDKTIELGRSFISPKYQAAQRHSAFALDNLFDALGTLIHDYEDIEHFFGKVTLYPLRNEHSKALIYAFVERHFRDDEDLVSPRDSLVVNDVDHEGLETVLRDVRGGFVKELGALSTHIHQEYGERVPPLLVRYMKLGMRSFGTAENKGFGDVYETAILTTINEIDEKTLDRYVRYEKL
ncbi:GNAT family N-acetyltransferase [Candidatus Woesearchaeota archaeon]|nr:GNAT family N-acetyltransferase [Candidatus Woesearchaeota archaeon]